MLKLWNLLRNLAVQSLAISCIFMRDQYINLVLCAQNACKRHTYKVLYTCIHKIIVLANIAKIKRLQIIKTKTVYSIYVFLFPQICTFSEFMDVPY